MRTVNHLFVCALLAYIVSNVGLCAAEDYFVENFDNDDWQTKWINSEFTGKEFGKFVRSHGKFYSDADQDQGIKTSQDARFYAVSTKFPCFSTAGKSVVYQFSVKHEQDIDCGGGYIKIFDDAFDEKQMHGETPYRVMFGPDICGPGTKKVQVIFNHKEKNYLTKKDIRCKDDVYTHVYSLIVRPDNTYEVQIDGEKVESGGLESDWDILPPKKIKDPDAKKPSDWDDRATIPDPDDKKPEDWDKPETIADPDAVKPDDWDDDMDGEWEAPKVDNPDYKGEWQPKQIDNPQYKGQWVHPEIDNPEYTPDPDLYKQERVCGIGFDLWQVKSGTIFDNILITDDVERANEAAIQIKAKQTAEKKMKEEQDKEESDKLKAADDDKAASEDEDDEEEEEDDNEGAAKKIEEASVPPIVEDEHDEL